MKKFIFSAVALAVCSLNPAHAGNTRADHDDLWDTLERAGVPVHVNDPEACDGKWGGGFYAMNPRKNTSIMLVCQDNGEGAGLDNHVGWTANDYDTLRHEAHHVLQDCLGGDIADGDLDPLFEDPAKHRRFVVSSLSQDKINWIIESYGEDGSDEETIILELEAFAVAEDIPASAIANGVRQACNVSQGKFNF